MVIVNMFAFAFWFIDGIIMFYCCVLSVVCFLRGTYNECVANDDDDDDDMKCQWEFGHCLPFTPQLSSSGSITNSTTSSVNSTQTLNETDAANNTVVEVCVCVCVCVLYVYVILYHVLLF